MKKIVTLVIMVGMVLSLAAYAQETGKTDSRVVGIQTGFVAGYNFNSSASVVGRDFGLRFTLNDSMQFGFRVMDGLTAASAVLLDFSYFLDPKMSVDVMAGTEGAGNMAAAVDFNYMVFRSVSEGRFSSSLKLKAGYLFDQTNGIGGGVLNAGLLGSVGY